MSSIVKKENLLSSWKEIAAYLDRNVRTCRRWENDLGLPIHRIDERSKSSVFAYKDELDKWLDKRLNKKTITKHTFFRRFKWHKSSYLILLIITAFFISLILIFYPHKYIPADFKIENSTLIILDKDGNELWQYETGIENLVSEKEYKEHFQYKRPNADKSSRVNMPQLIIKDINNDSHAEILFSTQTIDEWGEGELICFNHKGTCLWKFKAGHTTQFGSQIYSADYRIKGFDVCDLDSDGDAEIIVISSHHHFFPNQIVILSTEGEVKGEYWNSGYLIDFAIVDLNRDKKKEIIFVGVNNEYGKGCLVVFDSALINGASPQSGDYKCKELEPGSEKYYILFPRTDVDLIKSTVNYLANIDILENRLLSVTTGYTTIIFELNFNLELQTVQFSHTFEQLHKMALAEGKIKSELNEDYKKTLEDGLLYYDGENWTSKPEMSNPWQSRLK